MTTEQLLQLLIGALATLLGIVWTNLREQIKELKKENEDMRKEHAVYKEDVQGKFDRVGERFDQRYVSLAQDVAVMKAVQGAK